MEGVIVGMGFLFVFFGLLAAFMFPQGRHSVRVSRGGGSTVVAALGIPMSLMLLGVVTTAAGLYLP